jgi:hypothetical protein
MDLMNDDRTTQFDPTGAARLHALDMALAARTSLSVLITATPELAIPIAIKIAAGTDEPASDEGVLVVDAADNRDLQSTLIRAASGGLDRLRAVVVHDVDSLGPAQQAALMSLVADAARPRARACRIVATTSVPLYERVLDGSFDSRLFYCLNRIHIKAGAPPAGAC